MRASSILLLITVVVLSLKGCDTSDAPPLVVADLVILAPLPGTRNAVAYATMYNQGNTTITVQSLSSPQFEQLQIHETTISDGISKMHRLPSLEIGAGEQVILQQGAKHLMLMNPTSAVVPGDTISINLSIDTGSGNAELILQARAISRVEYLP